MNSLKSVKKWKISITKKIYFSTTLTLWSQKTNEVVWTNWIMIVTNCSKDKTNKHFNLASCKQRLNGKWRSLRKTQNLSKLSWKSRHLRKRLLQLKQIFRLLLLNWKNFRKVRTKPNSKSNSWFCSKNNSRPRYWSLMKYTLKRSLNMRKNSKKLGQQRSLFGNSSQATQRITKEIWKKHLKLQKQISTKLFPP